MKTILVATDFSTRSDRAIRRAVLLAHTFGASVVLVHVVDDDQSARIVSAEQEAANAVLMEQAHSLREIDGLNCDYRVVLGDSYEAIARAALEVNADLIVIGTHRKQALKDMFVGTTADRIIRLSRRPVLMATAVPAGPYRRALVATDLSEASRDVVRSATKLGLLGRHGVSLVHVFDAPESWLRTRGSLSDDQVKAYLAEEKSRAAKDLSAFATKVGLGSAKLVLEPTTGAIGHVVTAAADRISADVVVVGTHSRSRIVQAILGSVAEEVLRTATRDILVVPPNVDA